MTAHDHKTLVDGCYRCDLNRDEVESAHAETLVAAHSLLDSRLLYDRADYISVPTMRRTLDLIEDLVGIAEYRAGR